MFPSKDDPMKPLASRVASSWLLKAEKLAGVPKQDGTLWHGYRRGWATARKDMPAVDVAASGGWKSVATMQKSYMDTGLADQLRVVTAPVEVRETGT